MNVIVSAPASQLMARTPFARGDAPWRFAIRRRTLANGEIEILHGPLPKSHTNAPEVGFAEYLIIKPTDRLWIWSNLENKP